MDYLELKYERQGLINMFLRDHWRRSLVLEFILPSNGNGILLLVPLRGIFIFK